MHRITRGVVAAALAALTTLTIPAGANAATPSVAATAPAARTAAANCPSEVMFGGLSGSRTYGAGAFCLFTLSSNRTKEFVFQGDGNLVYYLAGSPLWASNTNGRGSRLALQQDGNMVIYDPSGRAIWATMTINIGSTTRRLVQQADGNVVLYLYPYAGLNQRPVWATNTNNSV